MPISPARVLVRSSLALLVAAPLAAQNPATPDSTPDQIARMVSRLDLEHYKATIKGLTQFGDRRQGTERNRKAVDWIEQQLRSYGCTNTERITYQYSAPAPRPNTSAAVVRRPRPAYPAEGGSHVRGIRARTGVNTDSLAQPDPRLRALDTEQSKDGERQEVYCTKIGTTHPDEMYIVGGHTDGIGWGEA